MPEQERIAAYLDASCAAIDAAVATLTAYRKALIHECVTGQRRITEADVAGVEKRNPPRNGC